MNKLNLFAYPAIVVLSLVAAVAAHAESPTVDDSATQVWKQTKTRAQVQAELAQARTDGSIKFTSITYNPLALAKSEKTRAAVHAEVLAERAANYAAAMYGEDSGSFYLAQAKPVREAGRMLAGASAKAVQ
jgi:hypothetical protein